MLGVIKNFLIPHRGNNHRAKILHTSSLVVVIILFLFVGVFATVIKKTHPEVLGISYSISEPELISLVNSQRQAQGLAALSESPQLADAARRKAADMFAKNYWAHFAPDGSTSPWSFIKDAGYSYTFAGENLAKGFTDPGSIVTAWMSSPTHRENLLSDKYSEVGFAIVPGTLEGEETVLIVQMFGSRTAGAASEVSDQGVAGVAEFETSPTPIPAKIVSEDNSEKILPSSESGSLVESRPKVDVKNAKTVSAIALMLLALVFFVDLIIVEKNKIPRLVGHNIDHIILISLFLLFVVLAASGSIL